mgnify:CR=1 FL=1
MEMQEKMQSYEDELNVCKATLEEMEEEYTRILARNKEL